MMKRKKESFSARPGIPPVRRAGKCCCQPLLPVGSLGPESHYRLLQSDEESGGQRGKAWLGKEKPWLASRLPDGGGPDVRNSEIVILGIRWQSCG